MLINFIAWGVTGLLFMSFVIATYLRDILEDLKDILGGIPEDTKDIPGDMEEVKRRGSELGGLAEVDLTAAEWRRA